MDPKKGRAYAGFPESDIRADRYDLEAARAKQAEATLLLEPTPPGANTVVDAVRELTAALAEIGRVYDELDLRDVEVERLEGIISAQKGQVRLHENAERDLLRERDQLRDRLAAVEGAAKEIVDRWAIPVEGEAEHKRKTEIMTADLLSAIVDGRIPPTEAKEKPPCAECEGSGAREIPTHGNSVFKQCSACNGTGEAKGAE